MVNETPLLHQSFGPRVFSLSPFLSLSLFFRLILWSAEALLVHFPAQASKTLSEKVLCGFTPLRGCLRPSWFSV